MSKPDTLDGIEKYLASGMVKGIGKEYASRLVKTFGREVFDVIENASGKLLKVEGIGRLRKERIKGNLTEEDIEKVEGMIVEILQSNIISSFFEGSFRVMNEASVMTTEGKEYRPDRVMIGKGRTIVLDYKTGKEEPEHSRQVERYGDLLIEMGYDKVEKYLLYIDDPCRIVAV